MMMVPPPLQTTTYRCHITRNDQNGLKPNERDRVHKRRARNWQEARRSFVYSRPTLFTGTATRQEERKPPRRVNCLFRCRKEGISHPCHVENTRDVVRRGHPSCSLRPRPTGTPIFGMSPSCLPAPLVVHPLSEPTRGLAARPPRPSPPTLSRPLHIRKDRHTHSPHSCTLQISSHQTPTSMARWERNTSGSR